MADGDDIATVRQTVAQMKDVPAPGYVYDHGEEWKADLDRLIVTGEGRSEVFVETTTDSDGREVVREFAAEAQPEIGQCYTNALQFAESTGAEYVEGYALLGGSSMPQSHAWNVLDGHIVDTTAKLRAGYGAVIPADHVEKALKLGYEENWWGVVFNEVYDPLP